MHADHFALEGLFLGTAAFFHQKMTRALTPARLQGYTMRRVLSVTPLRTTHSRRSLAVLPGT